MIELIKNVLNEHLMNSNLKYNGNVYFKCSPTTNISFERILGLKDDFGNYFSETLVFPSNFDNLKIAYFKEKASNRLANCVKFAIFDNEISEIKEYWDEKIIDDFNENLPKSKRGKIKAWYDE